MDTENPGAAQGRVAGVPAERPARSRTAWRARSRWLVHLGLLAFVAAALGTLQLLHTRNAIHADVGLAFAGLVVVHLAQRRHRIARMFAQLMRFRPRIEHELRLLASDAILAFVTVNVVVSGILDWGREPHCYCPSSTTFRQVALALLCRARRVPGRPHLAQAETPLPVHDPIAIWSMWCTGRARYTGGTGRGSRRRVVRGSGLSSASRTQPLPIGPRVVDEADIGGLNGWPVGRSLATRPSRQPGARSRSRGPVPQQRAGSPVRGRGSSARTPGKST
jgi:hypothetical protein